MESKYDDNNNNNGDEMALAPSNRALAARDRLNALVGKFDNFESEMKEGTRQRREVDEKKLEELKVAITALEKHFASESKIRAEKTKSLEAWFRGEIDVVKDKLLCKIEERMESLQLSIDELSDRIVQLSNIMEQEKKEILDIIDKKGEDFERRLSEFRDEFEKERVDRLRREKEILGRIQEYESQVVNKFDSERNVREQRYQELRVLLDESIALRKSRTERFHAFLEKEVAILKNSINEESIRRAKDDEEIVDTLARYTAKLQDSLRVINTRDV